VLEREQQETLAERVGRNDATFREANERIREASKSMTLDNGLLSPFICECANVECTEIVRMSCDEYEAVRANPTHFVNAPGHHVNALGWGRVVDEFDRYSVVEKIGDAGDVAAELDPRQEEPA
jgi:hypothetical protein